MARISKAGLESIFGTPVHSCIHGGRWIVFTKEDESFLAGVALLVSGMYDLRTVKLSVRSSYVKLSDDEVLALSAILQPEKVRTPLTLVYGEKETLESRRHPKAYAEVLASAGKPVKVVEIPGVNHFEIMRQLGEPGSEVARLALGSMGLGPAELRPVPSTCSRTNNS